MHYKAKKPKDTDALYGFYPVLEALKAGRRNFKRLLFASDSIKERFIKEYGKQVIEPAITPKSALSTICCSSEHQGVVAIVSPYPYTAIDKIHKANPEIILIADHIQDPQNLGAILRSSYCFGVGGVILPNSEACGISPSVVKASAGASEHLLVAMVENLSREAGHFRNKGYSLLALEKDGDDIVQVLKKLAPPCVLALGGETSGVTKAVRSISDYIVAIPMARSFNSLNSSAACAVALFAIHSKFR